MLIAVTKHSDRTYSVQIAAGQERVECRVFVDLPGASDAHSEERKKEIAVSRAKQLAYALIAGIDEWEHAHAIGP